MAARTARTTTRKAKAAAKVAGITIGSIVLTPTIPDDKMQASVWVSSLKDHYLPLAALSLGWDKLERVTFKGAPADRLITEAQALAQADGFTIDASYAWHISASQRLAVLQAIGYTPKPRETDRTTQATTESKPRAARAAQAPVEQAPVEAQTVDVPALAVAVAVALAQVLNK